MPQSERPSTEPEKKSSIFIISSLRASGLSSPPGDDGRIAGPSLLRRISVDMSERSASMPKSLSILFEKARAASTALIF